MGWMAKGRDGLTPEGREVVRLIRQDAAAFERRFAVLEGIVLRPPLASGRNAGQAPSYAAMAAAGPSGASRTARPSTAAPVRPQKATAGAKLATGAPKKTGVPEANRAQEIAPKSPATANAAEWQIVGEKKKRSKAAKKEARRRRQDTKRAAARLRAPKTAAVVVTLQPEAVERGVTYQKVLADAKRVVTLEELGVAGGLRIRVTATGARMLEVPGTDSGPAADALAEKLRATLNAEDVRVSRPSKCVELRILGLDDSVTTQEVVAAVARAGGCSVDLVRSGAIRSGPAGMGTAVVSCPVTAAGKIVEGRRLLVGWVSAQVKLLEARPLRCYRCLIGKHVGVKCTSEVNCSDCCFRCGQPGHKAGSCNAAPHCTFCASAGKPATHRAGGKSCAAAKETKASTKKSSAAVPSATTAKPGPSSGPRKEAAMEVN